MTRPLSFHGSCWEGVSEEACNFVRQLCSAHATAAPPPPARMSLVTGVMTGVMIVLLETEQTEPGPFFSQS